MSSSWNIFRLCGNSLNKVTNNPDAELFGRKYLQITFKSNELQFIIFFND